MKTDDEVKWEAEREDLFATVAKSQEIMEEKETLRESQMKSLEDGYKTTIEVQDSRIKMLHDENRANERLAGQKTHDLQDKVAAAETKNKDL